MAYKALTLVMGAIVAASPVAAQPDSGAIEPNNAAPVTAAAPAGTPSTRYCMRVELTGNVIEPVRCWTRGEWAEQGVDVDRDWADEGVGVKEPAYQG